MAKMGGMAFGALVFGQDWQDGLQVFLGRSFLDRIDKNGQEWTRLAGWFLGRLFLDRIDKIDKINKIGGINGMAYRCL